MLRLISTRYGQKQSLLWVIFRIQHIRLHIKKYGRRPTIILSLGLATVGTLIAAVGYNLIMIAIGVFMAGAGINVSA